MTVFVSNSVGWLALANHQLSAVHCPSSSVIELYYGTNKLLITGKNLGPLSEHLAAHQVIKLWITDKTAPAAGGDTPIVEEIELVRAYKKAAPAAAAAKAI